MPPIATGFWSHAPSGGEASDVRLRELYQRLRILCGPGAVDLIQDVAAGGAALEAASFMIVILTPSYLRDRQRMRNVRQFREIMTARGETDTILPVHYLDVAAFRTNSPREVCADPEILAFLESLHWHDGRALPGHDSEAPGFDAVLTGLANDVARILDRQASTLALVRNRSAVPAFAFLGLLLAAALVGGTFFHATVTDIAWPWGNGARPGHQAPLPAEVKDCDICPVMRLIPAGSFTMGTSPDDKRGYRDERPAHPVTIVHPFYLGQTPVTVGEFKAFMRENPSYDAGTEWKSPRLKQTDRDPVVDVNYYDMMAYIKWLKGKTARNYRLPSEAEWAFAAHGGRPTPSAYPWGDTFEDGGGFVPPRGRGGTVPVMTTKQYAFGLYDLLGNVWQWTADSWHANYQGAPSDGSAWVTGGAPARSPLRGGSWYSNAEDTRIEVRDDVDRQDRLDIVGFRLARTAD